jgi:hypothetical protein
MQSACCLTNGKRWEATVNQATIFGTALAVGARLGARVVGVAIGLGLAFWGLAMGVSLVMLPAGVVVALVGILIVVAAIFADVPRTTQN